MFSYLLKGEKEMAETDIICLSVDYGKTYEELIRRGRYVLVHPDITEGHFPSKRRQSGEVELRLVCFHRPMGFKEAIKELHKMGFRPAEPLELLTFGAECPVEGWRYPIVALGSICRCWPPDIVYIWASVFHKGRILYLDWVSEGGDEDTRFLAVQRLPIFSRVLEFVKNKLGF